MQLASQPIQFDYKPSPLKIINNGHTVQINYAPGSKTTVGGKEYEVQQFHFHHPSEEKIQGKAYDMVAHIVHKDSEGQTAVVAVLLQAGTRNTFIQRLWSNLPAEVGKEEAEPGTSINLADLLPAARGYYAFIGSLTTPPCTEGVHWFVMKTPVQISAAQVAAFGKLYPNNARPTQPTHGRKIEQHP
jgi:carbonic anhydrase